MPQSGAFAQSYSISHFLALVTAKILMSWPFTEYLLQHQRAGDFLQPHNATLLSFDIPTESAPKNVRYSGPVLDNPGWVQSERTCYPWDNNVQQPMVVIAFLSTLQNQKQDIQNCIDASAGLAINGLVTLGMAMENEQFNALEYAHWVNSVKHSLMFPDVDLVITHAGHGTVIRDPGLPGAFALHCHRSRSEEQCC